ncbi:MAG TPA: right-handed parallel beta-helix repeat-containing protein [Aliidongia sp.]|uniref:right-handed parallel beta-helix repeat-containing protein n=1 Tax=Aliidongia sp. TaxID=1914230 RepID=UPI002DDD30BB|nr:right-handed parallel beta-helix repeat-containing protein [Aliidongia sp.]HEV2674927.1 right-handed parallel beta-helix repeat-containing protein [Aliidongia sp.]
MSGKIELGERIGTWARRMAPAALVVVISVGGIIDGQASGLPASAATAAIPPVGSYVTPGTVGFLGNPATLKQYRPGGAVPPGCEAETYGVRCDQANLTLDSVHLTGGLYWTGTGNLTITNSIIEGGSSWITIYAAATSNAQTAKITVTNSTLRWQPGLTYPSGYDVAPIWTRGTQALIVQHCDLSGMPQGIDPGGNSVIQGNYIHDLVQNSKSKTNPTHLDGLFSQGGANILIVNNYIDAPALGAVTAALFIQGDGGNTETGIKIYANYLSGGAYVLRNETGKSVDVVNNTFGSGMYGYVSSLKGYTGTYGVWSGNVTTKGVPVLHP